MMANGDGMAAPLEIGRVVRRMTDTIGRCWRLLALVTLIFGIAPGLLYQAGLGFGAVQEITAPWAMLTSVRFASLWLLLMLVGVFAQAVIAGIFLSDQLGETPTLPGSVTTALALLLPIIALKIVTWLALGLASILLLFPALILLVRWFVALPAMVAEQGGPLRSLGRSRDLTRGSRWSVFGLIVLLGVLYCMMAGVVTPMAFGVAAGPAPMVIGLSILQQVLGAIASIVWTGAMAASFVELRELKEGAPSGRLAEVFA